MKGPGKPRGDDRRQELESSVIKIVFLDAIKIFQKYISPMDGPRCRFTPTCSLYGYRAINNHGPFLGTMLTADRLIRCNPWGAHPPFYTPLPNGLYRDPIEQNLLNE